MNSDIIDQFKIIARDPYLYAEQYSLETGRKAIANMCRYFPEELVHAAGFLPLRIWGTMQPSPRINAHLQTYCCNIVKSILDRMIVGELDYLAGAIFSHSCDSLQCLSDIWELNSQYAFHDTFNMPGKLDSKASRDYLIRELQRLKTRLEDFSGKSISDSDLQESIRSYETTRQLMKNLYHIKGEKPGLIPDINISDTIIASTAMERKNYNALLEAMLRYFSEADSPNSNDTSKVFLTGSICADPDFYQLLDALNITITGDDLCNGERYFERSVHSNRHPLEAIAERLTEQRPCPTKHHSRIDRANEIVSDVQKSNASAVIFYLHKFCEPHFFDYPYLKSTLECAGIPSILIEIEKPGYNMGQIKSRLEAFSEMIKNRRT